MRPLVITPSFTQRDSDTFNQYLSDIASIKMFTPEEEHECAVRAYNGDEKAIKELIVRNLRFVVSCAKQYRVHSVTIEDLVNEGNHGLMCAAKRFNPSKGFKFISYAVWYIRKDIQEYLTNYSRLIRLPVNKVTGISKYDDMISRLEQKLQRPVVIDDIIAALDERYTEDEIHEFCEISNKEIISLDKQFDEDSEFSLYDVIEDDSFGKTDDAMLMRERNELVKEMLNTLTPKQQQVMTSLYGLDGNAPMPLDSVGKLIGVSRERVRQIRDKVLKMLKKKYRKSDLKYSY